jgi:cellulose synthase/poly-beta-1,6-N-acetylglucosamine synthase-like glycosyltransferase
MSLAVDLVRSILRDRCRTDEEARELIDAALAVEVDPLERIAHRFGMEEATVYARAAEWAGLGFFERVPNDLQGGPQVRRLDSLGEARSVRGLVFNRDVTFTAPRFAEFIVLSQRLTPALRGRLCIVPPSAVRTRLAELSEDLLLEESRQRLARRWPFASASFDLPFGKRVAFVALLTALVAAAAIAPFGFKPLLLPPLAILLLPPAMLRLAAAFEVGRREAEPQALLESDLPQYSVLIPLRDEANMVPLLDRAMTALDYPPEKLDVLFVVEAKSRETVEAVQGLLGDPRYSLVEVPAAIPETKPKALDYALPLVRGAHVVVYDAEDIPAPDQLRRAASRFAAEPEIDCLQAELAIDNARETWLTALFAGEYAGLFKLLLPLFARLRLPVPLGGTSNHFRTAALREVGGWDAFNVTEDADLGIRLARLRYRTGTLASRTGEEAPIGLDAWMGQRTRWIKGWMQCFIVHNRSPRQLLADMGWRNFLAFEIYVSGLILSALLHTVFLVTLGLRIATGGGVYLTDPWDVAYLCVLILGYGGSAAVIAAGLLRAGQARLLPTQLLLPIYWLLHSAATVRAAHELLTRPYFWAKTAHGRTRVRR